MSPHRQMHARSSHAAGRALKAAALYGAPFLVLVYSEQCGHCVRMMPAFQAMLGMLGPSSCVVQLAVDALRQAPDSAPKRAILGHVSASGVPFVAVVTMAPTLSLVLLPDSNDRSVASLSEFATRHLRRPKQGKTPKVGAPRRAGGGRLGTGTARRAAGWSPQRRPSA